MPTSLRRRRPAHTVPIAVALCLLGGASFAQAQEHTLHVAVADGDGNPVTGLTRDDLVVQWDGEDLETTRFEAVDWPVRLTVFVDNSDVAIGIVPQMREGLRALLRGLPADIDVGFLTLARQPRWITRHTSDRTELEEDIRNIAPDSGTRPRFVDALVEETNRVDDDDREYYPVVIMVSGDGVDGSSSQQGRVDQMVERMVNNSMEVHTLLFISGRGMGVNAQQAMMGQSLTRITRGSFERIAVNTAIVERLEALARDIARKHRFVSSQYRITYRQPRNPSRQPTIGVSASRRGLQLMATLDGNIPARPQ